MATSLALTSGTGPALRLFRRVGKPAIFLVHWGKFGFLHLRRAGWPDLPRFLQRNHDPKTRLRQLDRMARFPEDMALAPKEAAFVFYE